jgi:glucose-1-phosphate thymidylyltransferase
MYFYDNHVVSMAEELEPSPRGEIEITDINREYMRKGKLFVELLGRGVAWLDAGKHDSLLQASTFVQTVQDRQGLMISCPEEIAFHKGFIDIEQLAYQAKKYAGNEYGRYLQDLVENAGQAE